MHQDLYSGGKKLVSATSLPAIIVKEFIERWKKDLCECISCQNELTSWNKPRAGRSGICGTKLAKKVAEEAADLSNIVHKEIGDWLENGFLPEIPNEWTAKIINELKLGNTKAILIAPEKVIRCDAALLSGSPDAVCEGFGKRFILDHKVKKSLDTLTGVQGYIYRLLVKHSTGEDIRWMLITWGQVKTGKVKLVWIDLDEWKVVTKALIVIWNNINPSREIVLKGLK